MNPDLGTELRSGRIISSSLETPVPTDPDMAQSSANDSDSNETSDISSQLSEIKESYERKINELQNEFSQLKDLMMAVISKADTENRQSTSKGPSKPAHTVGLDTTKKSFGRPSAFCFPPRFMRWERVTSHSSICRLTSAKPGRSTSPFMLPTSGLKKETYDHLPYCIMGT